MPKTYLQILQELIGIEDWNAKETKNLQIHIFSWLQERFIGLENPDVPHERWMDTIQLMRSWIKHRCQHAGLGDVTVDTLDIIHFTTLWYSLELGAQIGYLRAKMEEKEGIKPIDIIQGTKLPDIFQKFLQELEDVDNEK